jgi:hypothetical protein
MKKLLLVSLLLLMLAGCEKDEIPVVIPFPEVPADLMIACPDLGQLDPNSEKISELLTVVTKNYGEYYDCKVKVDNWIEWYTTQKKIFEKVGR